MTFLSFLSSQRLTPVGSFLVFSSRVSLKHVIRGEFCSSTVHHRFSIGDILRIVLCLILVVHGLSKNPLIKVFLVP